MTAKSARFSEAAKRYYRYADELNEAVGLYWEPPIPYLIVFRLPMPRSWSKKKRDDFRGKPHLPTPDKDNLEKAFLDALFSKRTGRKTSDSHVWDGRVVKLWDDEGSIFIRALEPLPISELTYFGSTVD
jgi:Holliday junction resolvase RusA-like endonuclease